MIPIGKASNAFILMSNDRNRFGKRVFTSQDEHTGEHQAYMHSTIDLSFDGRNYENNNNNNTLFSNRGEFLHVKNTKAAYASKDLEKIHNL